MDHVPSGRKSRYQTLSQDGLHFENDIPLQGRTARYASLGSHESSYSPNMPSELHKGADIPMKRRTGGKRVIFASLAVIVIPMTGLAALLLGLVLSNNVQTPDETPSSSLTLDLGSEFDSSAYYVDFNPTTLVTIASWSSTVAPLLAVCAMILVSFPLAQSLKTNSQTFGSDLPTPFQLSLLLETLTGGITPLWNALSYRRWPNKEQKMASNVRNALIVLAIFTSLGYVFGFFLVCDFYANAAAGTPLLALILGCIWSWKQSI